VVQLPKISIIIPLYNVVPYIRPCLDSVLAQTYHNLEIILINNGSTDGSTEIAESYADKDPRIVYLYQHNSGVSAARNQGLKLATGEYLAFVDADDTVEPDLIAYLYDNLTKNSADLASTTHKPSAHFKGALTTEHALQQLFLEQHLTFHLWSKLYKRSLWDGITFPEGHIYEDVATMVQIFAKCTKIHLAHKNLYHYRRREGSYVTTPKPSQFADLFRFAEQNLEFIKSQYPDLAPYAEKYLFSAARHTLQDLIRAEKLTKSARSTYLTKLKTYAPAALRLKETPKKEKLIAALAAVNKNLPLPLLSLQARRPHPTTYH